MGDSLYDPKCEELARYFLEDEDAATASPERISELAQRIQDAIEEYLAE